MTSTVVAETTRRASTGSWYLQVEWGTWVVWGYGPADLEHVSPASRPAPEGADPRLSDLLRELSEFELPEPIPGLGEPTEYRRVESFAWRWEYEPQLQGHRWRLAEDAEDAVRAARASLEHHRRDTQELLGAALRRDVRVRDPRFGAPTPWDHLGLLVVGLHMAASVYPTTEEDPTDDFRAWMAAWDALRPAWDAEARRLGWREVGDRWAYHPGPEDEQAPRWEQLGLLATGLYMAALAQSADDPEVLAALPAELVVWEPWDGLAAAWGARTWDLGWCTVGACWEHHDQW